MSAMVGSVAGSLTNTLNNPLNGTLAWALFARRSVFLRETKLTVDSRCAHHGPGSDRAKVRVPRAAGRQKELHQHRQRRAWERAGRGPGGARAAGHGEGLRCS